MKGLVDFNKLLKRIIFSHIEKESFYNNSNVMNFYGQGVYFIEIDDVQKVVPIKYECNMLTESFDKSVNNKKDYELKYHEKKIMKAEPSAKLLNFINRIKK